MTQIRKAVEVCRELFAEVSAEGYVMRIEGAKSLRGEFIQRAITECGMTKNGAATYYQNLKNEAAGKPLYYPTKKSEDQPKTFVDLTSVLASAPSSNVNEAVEEAVQHRWMVWNPSTNSEVASFETRSKAQEMAKNLNMVWKDRTKTVELA